MQFYIFGCVYMFARIALNCTATMWPFYLQETTAFKPSGNLETPYQVAAVPLVSFIGSLVESLVLQQRITLFFKGRLMPLILSLFITGLGSLPLMFLNGNTDINWLVYPCACIQGVGLALMLNTSTSLISDVLGKDNKSAAFVIGCYSFFDKLANGLLLYWLVANYSEDANVLKYIMSIIPTASALGTVILTYVGVKFYSDKMVQVTRGSEMRRVRE